MRKESAENVTTLLEEITELLPGKINSEIAEVADVSPDWVSLVRNGKKQSTPVQKAIASTAIEKGRKLVELGQRLAEALV